MSDPHILAELGASVPRRIFGTATVAALAGLLLWLAGSAPVGVGARLSLAALGLLSIWGAMAMWRATGRTIRLTEAGLEQSDGRILVAMDEIAGVERGLFAAKPSNGFLIRLERSYPLAWAPGLWWRWGRRLGVGGMTRAGEAKAMAELLALRHGKGR